MRRRDGCERAATDGMGTPSADRQTHHGTPYKWSDYMKKISFILLARHGHAESIICVNGPYDTLYTTKDDERDLRVQGTPHAPNTYHSPLPEHSKHCCVVSATRGDCKTDIHLPD